jgi:hypothetical protein
MKHEEEIRGILSNSLHADVFEKNKNLPDFPRVSGLNRIKYHLIRIKKIMLLFFLPS